MNTFTIICAAIIYVAFTVAICYLAYRIGDLTTQVRNLKEELRLKRESRRHVIHYRDHSKST